MNILKRFGSVYTFPATQISLSDNFRELLTRTQRLPGAHGGFDQLGDERGLSEIGMVRAEFWLHFDSYADATTKLDAIGQMNDAGVQQLFMQPIDQGAVERWCWARVNNQQAPQNVQDLPHARLRVPLVFQVSDPFWHTPGNGAVWGGDWTWGDGTLWGGDATQTVSGAVNNLSFTNNGNAFTLPKITIRPGAGASCLNPRIRRIVNGEIVDEVVYQGQLDAGDTLVIIPARQAVYLNNAAVYDSRFSARNAHWLRLLPGTNTLRVIFENSSDAADVTVRYLERYV